MTNTTTQHIELLLRKDGHQFAMVRKADLCALLDIAKSDPYSGRFLDRNGEYERKLAEAAEVRDECFHALERQARNARKHGEERKRYMANNRALLATVEGLRESLDIVRQAHLRADHNAIQWMSKAAALAARVCVMERILARIKRKFPAVSRWIGFVK